MSTIAPPREGVDRPSPLRSLSPVSTTALLLAARS